MKTLWVGSIPGALSPDRQVRLLGLGDGKIRAWDFAGATPEEQQASMELFARTMRGGRGQLGTKIFDLLDVDKENWVGTADEFVTILFDSPVLQFETEVIAFEGATILDGLLEAGEALLAAILAA